MGIFDDLLSSDTLRTLLGVGPTGYSQAPQSMQLYPTPQPQQPQQPPSQPSQLLRPENPADYQFPGAEESAGAKFAMPMPRPDPRNAMAGPVPPQSVPFVDESGQSTDQPAAGARVNVPLPQRDPRGLSQDDFDQRFSPAGNPGSPAVDEAGMKYVDPAARNAIAGPERVIPVPPANTPLPPRPNARDLPETATENGGLRAAFGLNPDTIRASLMGLGHGLSAVGSAPAGTPKGAMFARGAGGALEGATAAQQMQKDTLFKQSNEAFRSMLAERAAGNTEAYQNAQMEWLKARADSLKQMTAQGGKGSGGYQNSPEYKVLRVEEDAEKYRNNELKGLREEWKSSSASREDIAKDKEELQKRYEKYRDDLYRKSGIDPTKAERIKTMGQSRANPFPQPKTEGELNERIPPGGYYDTGQKFGSDGTFKDAKGRIWKGEPGKPVIAKKPEPQWGQQPQQQAPQQPPAGGPRTMDANSLINAGEMDEAA